jgi:hypothetical protein
MVSPALGGLDKSCGAKPWTALMLNVAACTAGDGADDRRRGLELAHSCCDACCHAVLSHANSGE